MLCPKMVLVRQQVFQEQINTPAEEIELQFTERDWVSERIYGKTRVAIAVGSRGISCLPEILKGVVRGLKRLGVSPYIIPAMGSHGGATPAGQLKVLASLGIDEKTCGVPIIASMDTANLGQTGEGIPCFTSNDALNAEAIVLINRIKPHTTMVGPIQSGLCKMLAVGLGRVEGAQTAHHFGLDLAVPSLTKKLLTHLPVAIGVAVLENGRHGVADISLVKPEMFPEIDASWLKLAEKYMLRIPYEQADVLIAEQIGKDISGAGLDTNVVGKWRRLGGHRSPLYHRIVVLDLTKKTGGNGVGIGVADFTTERLVKKLDLKAVYVNALAADFPTAGKIPIFGRTDRDTLKLAFTGFTNDIRLIHIRNTLELEEFGVSENLWQARPQGLTELRRYKLEFSQNDRLIDLDSLLRTTGPQQTSTHCKANLLEG